MTRFLFAIAGLAALAIAEEPDYFPLQVGNRWVYQCSRNCSAAETVTMEVVGTAATTAPDGAPYYILRGFIKDYWVRMVDSTQLVARDPDGSAEERLWYDFSRPENEEYETWVHPCNTSARITSREYAYVGVLGAFTALRIEYPASSCNLQGLVEEIFLPRIGLGRRVDLVPGSRTYDLVYARIGGHSLTSQSEISFGLALDRAVYSIGFPGSSPTILARMTLKNTTPDALRLTFPSNPYDLEIRNEQGETVYLWSQGKVFAQVVTELALNPGEQSYLVVIPLETDFSRAWPPGTYTAEARLNTTKAGAYAARVSFQVQWVR